MQPIPFNRDRHGRREQSYLESETDRPRPQCPVPRTSKRLGHSSNVIILFISRIQKEPRDEVHRR